MLRSAGLVVGLALFLMVGCGGTPGPTPAPTLDPASRAGRGQAVFRAHCATCHAVQGSTVIVGPSLAGIASRAGGRVPGLGAETYIRESILHPDAYLVGGFAPGTMPQNFARLLSMEEVDQLVAYLMTLE